MTIRHTAGNGFLFDSTSTMISNKSLGIESIRIRNREIRKQTALRTELLHHLDVRETALHRFLHGYLIAALRSSTDDTGTPLDSDYCIDDISTQSLLAALVECSRFMRECATDLTHLDDEHNGQNFWLTRNRHGNNGFWDEDATSDEALIAMQQLTHASNAFGEVDLYIGDDKQLHFSNAHLITTGFDE
ncbi:MAG: hypothetical protein LBK99_19585 [Opitutaceae bacterium]|nr:hypothetical protein [Opitutaceae bacterium]